MRHRGGTAPPRCMRAGRRVSSLLGDFGDQTHRGREGLELEVRPEISDGLVVPGLSLDRLDLDVSILERLPGLHCHQTKDGYADQRC